MHGGMKQDAHMKHAVLAVNGSGRSVSCLYARSRDCIASAVWEGGSWVGRLSPLLVLEGVA